MKTFTSGTSELEMQQAYREAFITSVYATILITSFVVQLNLSTHEKAQAKAVDQAFLSNDGHNYRLMLKGAVNRPSNSPITFLT